MVYTQLHITHMNVVSPVIVNQFCIIRHICELESDIILFAKQKKTERVRKTEELLKNPDVRHNHSFLCNVLL